MSTTVLNKSTHIKYFLRCLKTSLPTAYTSNDSQRMTLGFFILTALDILGALIPNTSESDRNDLINWIYLCQLPDGGFRGFTGADLGRERTEDNECWDPANLAATYFALASLAILGDDFQRLRRRDCLRWLKSLQHGDGTFGEALGIDGKIEGGRDVRYCYCAAAIRWMLYGGSLAKEEDIDVEGLLRFVRSLQVYNVVSSGIPDIESRGQTFEGGFASAPFHEAHAGWTYCTLATLSLLSQLHQKDSNIMATALRSQDEGIERCMKWLVSLQTSVLQEEDHALLDDIKDENGPNEDNNGYLFHVQGASITIPDYGLPAKTSLEVSKEELHWAGLTGRCNKIADTCYTFWAGGSLEILNSAHLLDRQALRRYLLEKTQHRIGGFGKLSGDPPDIMHSSLGLAGLAILGEPELKPFDPSLCLSLDIRQRFERLSWDR